jgi:hypothetical protein
MPATLPRRYALVRDEIDGSERPLMRRGVRVDFDNRGLAEQIARGYGQGVRVRDTEETTS